MPPAFDATAAALVRAALDYALRGWRVLPLHTPRHHGCSCGRAGCPSAGKHPRTIHGVATATCDAGIIRAWWRRWPDANVGIATGRRLVVLDVDGDLGQLSVRGRALPPTITVGTGHGWHYYFLTTQSLPCRVGLLPGVDLRGEGGYVVAPPSLHRSGHRYLAADGLGFADVGLATVPSWVAERLTARRVPRPADEWRSLLRSVVAEGRRNATLASLAGHLLRCGVDAGVTLELLDAWNRARCQPPLEQDEMERTVGSIARAEERRRAALRDAGRHADPRW